MSEVHLRRGHRAACGLGGQWPILVVAVSRVTCENCLRTIAARRGDQQELRP